MITSTRGEIVNRRARCGAATVRARETLERVPKSPGVALLREFAGDALARAEIDYAVALGEEETLSV